MKKFIWAKRLIIIILVVFSTFYYFLLVSSSLINTPLKANAEGKYLRVITEDTPFYKNASDSTPLFYLPYTYYVKSLYEEGDFTRVEVYGTGGIAAIDGYVPTSYLFDDELNVEDPFVVLKLTTTDTAVLYLDTALKTPIQYLFSDRQLCFYGSYFNQQENLYYVSYNGKLGYVKESCVFPFSIPNHPNELTFLIPDTPLNPPNDSTQSGQNEYTGLKAAIIVCLVFAGIIALIATIKFKPKKSVAVSFYDENDYE